MIDVFQLHTRFFFCLEKLLSKQRIEVRAQQNVREVADEINVMNVMKVIEISNCQ